MAVLNFVGLQGVILAVEPFSIQKFFTSDEHTFTSLVAIPLPTRYVEFAIEAGKR